jgi:hypothetical protein
MPSATKSRTTGTASPETSVRRPVTVKLGKSTDTVQVFDTGVRLDTSMYAVHQIIEALRNEASSWYVVEDTPANRKVLAKKDANRKAKGKSPRPRIIEGGYILLGGKARHHREQGTSVPNLVRTYLGFKQEQKRWEAAAQAHRDALHD